jgi:O-acetyl-ADP-ribose deacetylase (regulator of RNase III)
MVKEITGSLFESRAETLVNPVNCVGVMGKGLSLEFKKRFPAMFEDYARRCERKEVRLGEPYPHRDASGIVIVNFPTKDHWRSPSRLADIERGLDYFVQHHLKWGVRSVAFPQLGCGNGGELG